MPTEVIEATPIQEVLENETINVGIKVVKIDQTPIVLDNNNFALISVLNKLCDAIERLARSK